VDLIWPASKKRWKLTYVREPLSANFIVQCVYFEILLLALPVYEKYAQLPATETLNKIRPKNSSKTTVTH